MALSAIVGDGGYLGYAFAADGFVSFPKLTGAIFTFCAHIFLLAYGDDHARRVAGEAGFLSGVFARLRHMAKILTRIVPSSVERAVRAKPVGIPFLMLAVNGMGLSVDGVLRFRHQADPAMGIQIVLGFLVMAGCAAFAAADFVRTQEAADRLTKFAPVLFTFASLLQFGLAVATLNVFLIGAGVAFFIFNLASFLTRIDKRKGQR